MDRFLIICSAVAIVFVIVRGLKLLHAPRGERPIIWAMCGFWFTRSVIVLMLAPTVAAAIDRLVNVPNLSFVIALLFFVATAAYAQRIFFLIDGTRAAVWSTAARCLLMSGYLLVGLIAFLVVSDSAKSGSVLLFDAATQDPYLAISLAIYFAISLAVSVYISVRWLLWIRARFEQASLRRVVRIHALLNLVFIGFGWSGISLAVVVAGWFHAETGRWPEIASFSAGAGTLLVLIGNNLATWGPQLRGVGRLVARNWCDLLDCWRLRSLWRLLRPVAPEMVHTTSSWREWLSPRSRLFWRMIEINDWLYQLSMIRAAGNEVELVKPVGRQGVVLDDLLRGAEADQMRFAFMDEREFLVAVSRTLSAAGRT
ncbi:DUF6545 domain-containing protein [Amycolatopsis sp. NPDC049868]|uniref:DUF6545 domain-containing protein n=1 Tax=Amycolatopsis sp. NPDC049868 TaxID=3363934 RepID=UPI00378ADD00